MDFTIHEAYVPDEDQRRNNTNLLDGLNTLGNLFYYGTGVPTIVPVDKNSNPRPAIYLRLDGGNTTTLYVYSATTLAWTAK